MESSLEIEFSGVRRAVSRRVGIIRECIELMIDNDDPPIFYCATNIADTTKYNKLPCYNHNGGAGLTRESAYLAALCESLERYCVSFQPDSLIEGSYNQLVDQGYHMAAPQEYQLFSESQYMSEGFRFDRFSDNLPIRWVKGECLTCSCEALIPACLVYIPYVPHEKSEPLIAPSISTGLACGRNRNEATVSGMLEIIERDAFSISWLNMISGKSVGIEGGSLFHRDVFAPFFDIEGLSYCINDLTLDIDVPVFLVSIVADTPFGRAASCGCAARFDPETALKKAFIEAAQSRVWIKQIQNMDPEWSYGEFKDIKTFEDHVKLYGSEKMLSGLNFYRSSGDLSAFPGDYCKRQQGKGGNPEGMLLDLLARNGMEVFTVDVTTPEIADLGFSIVKTVVPQAHPLHGDHNYRFLGGKRLYEIPVKIGALTRENTEADLNPIPHPFP